MQILIRKDKGMGLHEVIYNTLVRKNENVQKEYERYVVEHVEEHYESRFKHWKILWKLNWHYRIKHNKEPMIYWTEPVTENNKIVENQKNKKSNTSRNTDNKVKKMEKEQMIYPESKSVTRKSVEEMLKKIKSYDVVSFDMFDTLVFRAVEDPKDIFRLVGARLNIPNFRKIRSEIEKEIKKSKNNSEVTIEEIYEVVEKRFGVPQKKGVEIEFEYEKAFCYANPYMLEVYNELLRLGKTVVVTSNMYLNKKQLEEILFNCSYTKLDNIFVSCDYDKSKKYGELQKEVSKYYGENCRIIHLGDNYFMDIEGSRIAGWSTIYYKNVSAIGKEYRPNEMSTISGSIYKGLVNGKLHSGLPLNTYYEYGYSYVGYLVVGFCKWLNALVAEKKIDKLLFVARDMNIVHKVYESFFVECESEYIKASRTSSIHLSFNRHIEHFFDWHVRRRFSSRISLEQTLDELGLAFLSDKLSDFELELGEVLSAENIEQLKQLVYENKKIILDAYETERSSAREYYENVIGEKKNVCIVDLGWKGSTFKSLKYFLNEECDMKVKIISAMLGMEGHGFVDEAMSLGEIYTYVFSNQKNKDLMMIHNQNGNIWRRMYEIIFTSNEQSLLKFDLSESGEVIFEFLRKEIRDDSIVDNLHQGILDFAKDYKMIEDKTKINFVVESADAYRPLQKILYEEKFNFELFKRFEVCFIAGNVKEENAELFADVVVNGGK